MELHPESPLQPRSIRTAEWGKLHVVRPGIGVEVLTDQNEGYVEFIATTLAKIAGTAVGRELLAEFDPQQNSEFQQIRQGDPGGSGGAYADVTVIITQPPPSGVLETKDFQGRRGAKGAKVFNGPRIPAIWFFDRPAKETPLILKEGREIHHDRIVHPDFSKPADFDIALFHEFCHAYYSQLGVADFMSQDSPPLKPPHGHQISFDNVQPYIEEQLVCGLLAGKGIKYCENTYRHDQGIERREKYADVGLAGDPELTSFTWPERGSTYTSPVDVLLKNMYSGADSRKWRGPLRLS